MYFNSSQSYSAPNLVELLLQQAQQLTEKPAYIFLKDGETESDSLNYQQLGDKVQVIATYLQSVIASPGERALLLFPPGLEFIITLLGCLCAQIVAVPVYPPRRNQKLDRVLAIARDAEPSLILTTFDLLESVQSQFQKLASYPIRCLDISSLPDQQALGSLPVDINPNTLALLQYTSGSTGNPKGVMITHGNLLYNLAQIQAGFRDTRHSRGVIWLPPYHDMGLVGGILEPLFLGSLVVLMPPATFLQKPIRWLQAISRYRATTSGGPNFAYDICTNRISPEQKTTLDLSCWNVAFNGAEPIRAETLQRFSKAFAECGFRSKAFYPCYGMAETTLIISGGIPEREPILKHVQADALAHNQIVPAEQPQQDHHTLVGCGSALLKQDIIIVDPQSQIRCSTEQIGEIWVAGQNVAQGYWNRELETRATFAAHLSDTHQEPYLRTGDLGFLDSDGELFVTGRLKDVIIIRGRNYYPQDIELRVEKSHLALRANSGAAFSVEVEGTEQLVIVHEIQRTYLRQLDVAEVVSAIRRVVSLQYELYVYGVVLLRTDSLPKTSSGKVQRYACRAGFLEKTLDVVGESTAPVDSAEPQRFQHDEQHGVEDEKERKEQEGLRVALTQEDIEAWLMSHLARYLKISPNKIDPQVPFADYGLDSSVALSLTEDLENWLGTDVEPDVFWRYPSIRNLSKYFAEIE